jgi:two-component system response regulator YesN
MYRILIVDDEKKERDGIARLIQRFNYSLEIKKACNGEEALKIFEQNQIDILLTDIRMPFMDGMRLIEELHRRGKSPVSIIYSAYGEFEYAQNAISLGVLEYLLKPIQLDAFQKLMKKVIDLCREKDSQESEKKKRDKEYQELVSYKANQQLLKYLENEISIAPQLDNMDIYFGSEFEIPIIISCYSTVFALRWEEYKIDLRRIWKMPTVIINRDDNQILVLLRSEKKRISCETLREYGEEVLRISKRKYQTNVFVVVGNETGSLQELKKEYEEIKEQLDYQFFSTESMLILRNTVYFEKSGQNMLKLYIERILNCAKMEDFAGMEKEFEKIFSYIEKNTGFSSIYVKYTFLDVLKGISEYVHYEQRLIGYVERIYASKNLEELRNIVTEIIKNMQEISKKENKENRIVQLAKEIIYEDFGNGNLGVATIAEQLKVSVAYLSSLFKMETGQNLVKFITKYRIEKSKELLRHTNMRINDIANHVGYMNPSYYISIFRNHEGVSPTQYRGRAIENEK